MNRIVAILIIISAVIYGIQILLFHDPRTTGFYILQDLAFMPVTIAIATLVVGQLMNESEKKQRIEKTKMLTSSFFVELGAPLMKVLIRGADDPKSLIRAVTCKELMEERRLAADKCSIDFSLTEDIYNDAHDLILASRTETLVIASNPSVLEHECFTDLLWSVFHLTDEFSLHGAYENLTSYDIAHLEDDFANVLRLLVVNGAGNAEYLRDTYPNFYANAMEKFGM
jgi:hypothetical protein